MRIRRGGAGRRGATAIGTALVPVVAGVVGAGLLAPTPAAADATTGDHMMVGLAGKCMDVAWGDSTAGTAVNLFTCNGTPAQQWHFDTSTGQLTALGKCLDIPDAQIVNGNHLWIWDCNT